MTTDYATTHARSLHLITCTLCSVNIRPTIHTASQLTCWLQACSRTLTATNAFMFTVPVLLLAFDGAVAGVPTAVVHCFRLTVVALKHTKHAHLNWCYQPDETSKTAHVLWQGTGIRDQQWAVLLTTENLLVGEKMMMPAGEFLWLSAQFLLVLWPCWLGDRKDIQAVKKLMSLSSLLEQVEKKTDIRLENSHCNEHAATYKCRCYYYYYYYYYYFYTPGSKDPRG